nr:PREDICTED: uncharacterized protein LOC105678126 [Linepithema humile]
MGFKWFRARLKITKKASKIPVMTGLYRRVSYVESFTSTTRKNEISNEQVFEHNVPAASINNESMQHDSKADLTSQLSSSSSIDSKESNHTVENAKSSAKDSTINGESSTHDKKELNKINKDESNVSDTKNRVSSDNELVI